MTLQNDERGPVPGAALMELTSYTYNDAQITTLGPARQRAARHLRRHFALSRAVALVVADAVGLGVGDG
jgi:hypothetical protein